MTSDSSNHEWTMKMLEKFKGETHFTGAPYIDFSRLETQELQLKADKSVERGKFKPHPQITNTYLAHPETIRALRPEILLAGDIDEFAESIPCPGCSRSLDKQFWIHCPYCESDLK